MPAGNKVRKQNHIVGLGIRIIGVVFLFLQPVTAQIPDKDFRRLVLTEIWSAEDLNAIENGEAAARSLRTDEKQDIATIGIVKIKGLSAVSMTTFREALNQKKSGSMKTGRRFSDPPLLEDIGDLKLDEDYFDQLRKCAPGKCDLNLSAEDIRRVQDEIDWDSANAEEQATDLVKKSLLGYVRNYLERGNGALGTYDNRRRPVDLAASHRLLLSRSTLISELAPEFVEYLQTFPASDLEAVDSSIHWSVVDFGLKPSITLSHTAAYTQHLGTDSEQLFIASKQIYATRYLDSSLTFMLLLRVATDAGTDTYLILLDRSRSDALEGLLGGFARKLVRKESIERIKALLDRAHLKLLAGEEPTNKNSESQDLEGSSTNWLTETVRRRLSWALVCLVIAAALFLVIRRTRVG